mgnify:CR=1 FL=1
MLDQAAMASVGANGSSGQAQAQVAAISHGSRVLGMHCVAKRIDSPMARQWLSAVGVDFAQGFLLEGPLPITQLASLRLTEPVRRRRRDRRHRRRRGAGARAGHLHARDVLAHDRIRVVESG